MWALMLAIKGLREKHWVPICLFVYVCVTAEFFHILLNVYFIVLVFVLLTLPSPVQFFFVVSYSAVEKTNFPLRENKSFILSFSELSSVISLNWLWITEVSLQVSVVASGEEYLSACGLHICLHVCVMIWVHIPHNSIA